MDVIKIPKAEIIELIKHNECSFYEREIYTDIKVKVWVGNTELKDDKLYLSSDALASLLFDKVYSDDYLTVLVV